MNTKILAALAVTLVSAGLWADVVQAGPFSRRVYRQHYPVHSYYRVTPAQSYYYGPVRIFHHVNDPGLYRDESGYGES